MKQKAKWRETVMLKGEKDQVEKLGKFQYLGFNLTLLLI